MSYNLKWMEYIFCDLLLFISTLKRTMLLSSVEGPLCAA